MAGMPDWFAKTREMFAMDKYFSLHDAKNKPELTRRYKAALGRMATDPIGYGSDSEALRAKLPTHQRQVSLGAHFSGDWVHPLYFVDRALYGHLGGLYWPTIPSTKVIDEIRRGIEIAIHKALGDAELVRMGFTAQYRDALWAEERASDVDVADVTSLATSWNCVAPTGSDFFDVAALRGASVVEFAIATPQPYGISMTRRLLSMVENQQISRLAPDAPDAPEVPAATE